MCFSNNKPSYQSTATAPAPTAVTSADVSTDSARKAATTARRKSGFTDTIVSSTPAALTQQASDGLKTKLG